MHRLQELHILHLQNAMHERLKVMVLEEVEEFLQRVFAPVSYIHVAD